MEEGHTVWITHPETAWTIGVVSSKVVNDDGSMRLEVKVADEDAPRVVTAPPEAGGASASELPDVKPTNDDPLEDSTDGRGGVDDLIDLTHLHEPAILHVLATRFANDVIYTYTGPILLAVNPFQRLPLYTKEMLQQYYSRGLLSSQGVKVDPLPPHVYATADAAFRCMKDSDSTSRAVANRNQSLLVSGESGAGKTVTTKIIMQYLATVGRPQGVTEIHAAKPAHTHHPRARRESATEHDTHGGAGGSGVPSTPHRASMSEPVDYGYQYAGTSTAQTPRPPAHEGEKASIEDRVLQSNPILEAFGNAKTVRNENSSRFGKFIELDFNGRCFLVGAQIETYLLEKVRLVFQAKGERNYHVFYQLCSGADEIQRKRWRVKGPDSFSYINQSGCMTLTEVKDEDEWAATIAAMNTMGFRPSDQDAIFTALAGLLHLGNVTFEPDGDKSKIAAEHEESAAIAAELLGFDLTEMATALTSKKIYIGSQVVETFLDAPKAMDARDGLVKNIYSKMFDWIVSMINYNIKPVENHSMFIGVLDIFGFEHFKFNSFEQLCINYANETLQQQFNEFVFKLEQAEYTRENIEWKSIVFEDNKDCLELIEGRSPPGILALVDEQCLVKSGGDDDKSKGKADAASKGRPDEPIVTQADQNLAQKLYKNLEAHKRFVVDKKDRPKFQFSVRHYAGLVTYSSAGFVEKNKDQIHDEASDLVKLSSNDALHQSYAFVEQVQKERASAASSDGGARKKGQLMSETVGAQFKRQLAQLLGVIKATTPHYVRCLKPNPKSVPKEFHRPDVVGQLRCGGVLEAVRVARLGYPVRLVHPLFISQYRCLLPKAFPRPDDSMDDRSLCRAMGRALGIEEDMYQVGLTKVFFKKGSYGDLEGRRTKAWKHAAVTLQAFFRCRQANKRWKRYRNALLRLQYLFRKRRKLRHASSRVVSRFMRRECARIRNKRGRFAIVRMQSHLRRKRAVAIVTAARRNYRATRIQTIFKMLPKRRQFKLMRSKAVIIQCAIRCCLARRKLKKLRQEARELGNLKDQNVQLRMEVRRLQEMVVTLQRELAVAKGGSGGAVEAVNTSEGETFAPTQGKSESSEPPSEPSPFSIPAPELSELRAELSAERQRSRLLQARLETLMLARSTEPVAAAPTPVGGGDGGTDSTAESSNEAPLTSGLEGGVVLSDVAVSVSSAPMVSTFGDFGSFSGMSGSAPDRDMLMRFEQKEAQFRREIQTLQKRVQRAEKQCATAAGSRLQAEQKQKELMTRTNELESELKRTTQAFERMKKQAEETLATTTKAYKQQVDALTEKIGSDDQQQREMGARIQQLMQEIKAEKDMSKVASRKITELTDTVDSLNKARTLDSDVKMALAQRLDSALMEKNVSDDELNRAISQVKLLETTIKSLQAGEPVTIPEPAVFQSPSMRPSPAHPPMPVAPPLMPTAPAPAKPQGRSLFGKLFS